MIFFLIVGTVLAAQGYHLLNTIKIMALDPKTDRIYLSSADAGGPTPTGGDPKGRPSMVLDSVHLLVVGK